MQVLSREFLLYHRVTDLVNISNCHLCLETHLHFTLAPKFGSIEVLK